jgi:hypothetical protein
MIADNKIQAVSFQWHWNTYPAERMRLFMNYNNPPSKIAGGQLKAQGMLAGVADMTYLMPSGRVAFIEFKTEVGKQRPEQVKFQGVCEVLNIPYFICRSLEEFQKIILSLQNV